MSANEEGFCALCCSIPALSLSIFVSHGIFALFKKVVIEEEYHRQQNLLLMSVALKTEPKTLEGSKIGGEEPNMREAFTNEAKK